jgi:hypothetical protein
MIKLDFVMKIYFKSGEWKNLTGQISPKVRFWLILKSQFYYKKKVKLRKNIYCGPLSAKPIPSPALNIYHLNNKRFKTHVIKYESKHNFIQKITLNGIK